MGRLVGMRRVRFLWLVYGVCVAVAAFGMAYLTHHALRLERTEREARVEAAVQERVRLALWRMEVAALALLTNPFPPNLLKARLLLRPGKTPQLLLLEGRLEKPLPAGKILSAAKKSFASSNQQAQKVPQTLPPLPLNSQILANQKEWHRRQQAVQQAVQNLSRAVQKRLGTPPQTATSPYERDMAHAFWVEGELLLVRPLAGGDGFHVHLLDFAALKAFLLGQIRDLLPDADIVAAGSSCVPLHNHLATLPLALVPGPVKVDLDGNGTPLGVALAAAWAGFGVAALAFCVLLGLALAMARRRQMLAFTLTHELRTPLTTFFVYTEMLKDGMVPQQKRARYMERLHAEAARMSRLVENVLLFARGAQQAQPDMRLVEAKELVEALGRRMESLACRAGMEPVLEIAPDAATKSVHTDPSLLEHIVANLVENACKYAKNAADRRIHLHASVERNHLALRITDHGPGIPPDVRRRLFKPFVCSKEKTTSLPGIGLGLAISSQLAKSLNAKLLLEKTSPSGTTFLLLLPLCGDQQRT